MVSDRIGCWWIVASYLVAQSLHPSHSITPFPLPPPKLLLFALQIIHYTSHFPFVYMKIYSNPSNSHSHYFLLGGNGRNKQNLHFPGAAQCPLLLSLTFLILPIFIFRSLTKQALPAKSSIPQYTGSGQFLYFDVKLLSISFHWQRIPAVDNIWPAFTSNVSFMTGFRGDTLSKNQ